jgi:hypothetical protein
MFRSLAKERVPSKQNSNLVDTADACFSEC